MAYSRNTVYKIALTGVLCAIGILVPMFMPKVQIPPFMSFTLASHVAVFIAMFISPGVAAAVSAGTTIGFLFSGLNMAVVARAASHLVFSVIGAFILKKNNGILNSVFKAQVFSIFIAILHGLVEILAVLPFFIADPSYYSDNFLYSVVLLVGVGTVIHSIIDFIIAYTVWLPLRRFVKPSLTSKAR